MRSAGSAVATAPSRADPAGRMLRLSADAVGAVNSTLPYRTGVSCDAFALDPPADDPPGADAKHLWGETPHEPLAARLQNFGHTPDLDPAGPPGVHGGHVVNHQRHPGVTAHVAELLALREVVAADIDRVRLAVVPKGDRHHVGLGVRADCGQSPEELAAEVGDLRRRKGAHRAPLVVLSLGNSHAEFLRRAAAEETDAQRRPDLFSCQLRCHVVVSADRCPVHCDKHVPQPQPPTLRGAARFHGYHDQPDALPHLLFQRGRQAYRPPPTGRLLPDPRRSRTARSDRMPAHATPRYRYLGPDRPGWQPRAAHQAGRLGSRPLAQ